VAQGGNLQLAAAFDRAVGERLAAAERLALWMPQLFASRLVDCDVGYRSAQRFFLLVVRLAGATADDEARFRFWCARSGGLASSLDAMKAQERSVFEGHVAQCDVKTLGVRAALLGEALGRVVAAAGTRGRRPTTAEGPVLSMDAGSQGFAGVTWDRSSGRLFVPGAIAPPVGDDVDVRLRAPRAERPLAFRARVVEVRPQAEARPGAPAGFTLHLAGASPELAEAIARHAPRPEVPGGASRRAAPRYAVNAPVKVQPSAPAAPGPGATTARIEYATDEELAEDYVENLSQGGAFVRTHAAQAIGTRLTLEMRLPGAIELRAPAVVMFRDERGIGVKFELDADGEQRLATAIARISARPRRALLVDDDALILHTLGDALQARGFEVLTARDGAEGLEIVMEELLSLDLLVTDVRMPNMDGEAFVRTIRGAGGEEDLAIVVVAGTLDAPLEARLEKAGADAVLDKALGPANLAAAADAALERKRQAGA
jgi:CheY-like chemotaxis protein